MPTYEYHCKDCNHNFEIEQRMSDAVLVKCPKCNADSLQRLISATSFQLKGSGWYKTDYASSSSSSSSSSSKSSSSSTSSGCSGNSSCACSSASSTKKTD